MWVSIRNDTVTRTTFWTDGCAYLPWPVVVLPLPCYSLPVQEVKNIDKDAILEALDGLPKAHIHCAEWAAETLHMAIEDYQELAKIRKKRNGLV